MRERSDIRAELHALCERVPGISGAAYFGSVARDEGDRFSDIDLVVGCEPSVARELILQLHIALGLVLFRPFTQDRKPGGRYWFRETNPFSRLDVSFYRPSEFESVVRGGRGYAQPPLLRMDLASVPRLGARREDLPAWSQLDHDFAGALRLFHESAKAKARGHQPRRSVEEADVVLQTFASKGLRAEAWDLYKQSLQVIGSPTKRRTGRCTR